VRSDENEDEDDAADYDMPDGSGLARSMPIHLVRPKRTGSANLEPKTSLTDRKGLLVPGLKSAMREPELAAPRVQASFVVGSINDVKARTPFPRLLSEARGNADKGKSKA
jgi:hypothetical protein